MTNEQLSELNKNRYKKRCETNLKKYGRTNVGQFGSEEHKIALIEKYGSIENAKAYSVEKRKDTCLQKYGTSTPNQYGSDSFKSIILNKYGYENAFQVPQFKEKLQNTQRENHNGLLASQDPNVKSKIKETCTKNDTYSKAKTKRIKTMQLKYGCDNNSQTPEYHQLKMRKYVYNDLTFDSSWELAFYVFFKDKNVNIIQSTDFFEYPFNGKVHRYFPDFKMPCGLYVEIKGDQFVKSDGTLQNVYNKDDLQYPAKYNCMVENSVVILTKVDIKPFLNYMQQKYGSSWKKDFRKKQTSLC